MQGLRGDYCVELGDLHWVTSEAQNGGDQTSKKSERVIGWEVRVGMKNFGDGVLGGGGGDMKRLKRF